MIGRVVFVDVRVCVWMCVLVCGCARTHESRWQRREREIREVHLGILKTPEMPLWWIPEFAKEARWASVIDFVAQRVNGNYKFWKKCIEKNSSWVNWLSYGGLEMSTAQMDFFEERESERERERECAREGDTGRAREGQGERESAHARERESEGEEEGAREWCTNMRQKGVCL